MVLEAKTLRERGGSVGRNVCIKGEMEVEVLQERGSVGWKRLGGKK